MNLTWNEMLDLRRDHAKANNSNRFTINHITVVNRTGARNKDKDGLPKDKRQAIEAIKDRKLYPDDVDLFE